MELDGYPIGDATQVALATVREFLEQDESVSFPPPAKAMARRQADIRQDLEGYLCGLFSQG